MLIDIDAETAVNLALHLKDAQLEAMSNGNDYVPILPPFELYRMRISHGRDSTHMITDAIGIKGTPKDAKLLNKFFTRLAAETRTDYHDGLFLPEGAVGPSTYEQVLKDNNFSQSTWNMELGLRLSTRKKPLKTNLFLSTNTFFVKRGSRELKRPDATSVFWLPRALTSTTHDNGSIQIWKS